MVNCSEIISYNDGVCCIQNVFTNTNTDLGYFTTIFCTEKQHQQIVTMNQKQHQRNREEKENNINAATEHEPTITYFVKKQSII